MTALAAAATAPMSVPRKTLLIVDDDEGMRETLVAILGDEFDTVVAGSAERALEALQRQAIDLLLADVRLPGMSGLDLLRLVKRQQPLTEVLVISAVSEVQTAVQAMKDGAFHYVTKDFDYDALRSLLRNASEKQDLGRRVRILTAQVEEPERQMVRGPSPAMRAAMNTAGRAAEGIGSVLILGESGTGKELVARWIHERSPRARGPFIAVNLGAIPPNLVESTLFGHERGSFTGAVRQQVGKFELASEGTLFLDEIGDLPLELQVKLLRAIQEREIERVGGWRPIRTEFRLISATHHDLESAVREGRFRADLYYRINVLPVHVPPLRDRPEDVPLLAQHFLDRTCRAYRRPPATLGDSAAAVLRHHPWPGNVRELQNLVERLVAMHAGPVIEEDDLPEEYQVPMPRAAGGNLLDAAVVGFTRNYILEALQAADGNVAATARALGVPLSTLKHRMRRLDLRDPSRPRR
jgi:DNA-binding NtrC family response regulator